MASGEKKRPSPTGDAEDSDKRVKAGIETNDDNIDKMIDLQGEMEIAQVAEEEDFSMTAVVFLVDKQPEGTTFSACASYFDIIEC